VTQSEAVMIYQHFFTSFSTSYKRLEVKENLGGKRKDHGAVDEPSSEQHFCKLDTIIFLVGKSGAIALVLPVLQQAGCPEDKIVPIIKLAVHI